MQANKVPHMTKNLRKANMKRSQLKTKYFRTNSESCDYTRSKRIFV